MGALIHSVAGFGLLLLFLAQSIPAAGGWYLLEPPVMVKKNAQQDHPELFGPGADTPFKHWYRRGAFDSAKECMTAREKLIREGKARFEGVKEYGFSKSFSRASLANVEAAECIASDDRRLTQ